MRKWKPNWQPALAFRFATIRFNPISKAMNHVFDEAINMMWPTTKIKNHLIFETSVKVVCRTDVLILKIIKNQRHLKVTHFLRAYYSMLKCRISTVNIFHESWTVYEQMVLIHFWVDYPFREITHTFFSNFVMTKPGIIPKKRDQSNIVDCERRDQWTNTFLVSILMNCAFTVDTLDMGYGSYSFVFCFFLFHSFHEKITESFIMCRNGTRKIAIWMVQHKWCGPIWFPYNSSLYSVQCTSTVVYLHFIWWTFRHCRTNRANNLSNTDLLFFMFLSILPLYRTHCCSQCCHCRVALFLSV